MLNSITSRLLWHPPAFEQLLRAHIPQPQFSSLQICNYTFLQPLEIDQLTHSGIELKPPSRSPSFVFQLKWNSLSARGNLMGTTTLHDYHLFMGSPLLNGCRYTEQSPTDRPTERHDKPPREQIQWTFYSPRFFAISFLTPPLLLLLLRLPPKPQQGSLGVSVS